MAEAFLKHSRLKLVFENGMDDEGNPVYKSKTFANVRRDSTADELYQVSQAIGSLAAQPLWLVERNDSYDIGQ